MAIKHEASRSIDRVPCIVYKSDCADCKVTQRDVINP